MEIQVKWQGRTLVVEVADDATVGGLKHALFKQTCVDVKRQKLLNLKEGGKPARDDRKLSELALPKQIMLMGTPDAEIETFKFDEANNPLPEVDDDLDLDGADGAALMETCTRPENLQKLARRVENYKLEPLNPPREGKKLLVLDIDYTLFDHRSNAEHAHELMRPFLHEFLTIAYRHYDIIIWSATNMKWIKVKMEELGVLSHSDYKITMLVDHLAMVTVQHEERVFNCKPLGYIWQTLRCHYAPHNTIMFDDLSRNFIMNPQNGLKIRPFKNAHTLRATDRELLKLSEYLECIAELSDLSGLNHRRWERYMRKK
ncbi:Ubiquitin-like domain-containing CTD phosphatase 1 [Porphyridium purpureum]|uniref:protein-serine/threonine phosphatase n=1 Tax=Porphyridium purpureum TaxID=35688 RepID=A0A5J4YPC8_PORPP|nr:Ubiquitin-like domain-containing CTD phosphatase 1 [Porphyridium purpureum]|eukprot:POR7723..scf222_8